jgi:hypothetical protein
MSRDWVKKKPKKASLFRRFIWLAGYKTATGRHIAARAEENPTVGGNNRNIFHSIQNGAHPKACQFLCMHRPLTIGIFSIFSVI